MFSLFFFFFIIIIMALAASPSEQLEMVQDYCMLDGLHVAETTMSKQERQINYQDYYMDANWLLVLKFNGVFNAV